MLRRYLDLGDAPTQGGERPHVTVTIDFNDLKTAVGAATLEHGGPISAGQARMPAERGEEQPAVLGLWITGAPVDSGPVAGLTW